MRGHCGSPPDCAGWYRLRERQRSFAQSPCPPLLLRVLRVPPSLSAGGACCCEPAALLDEAHDLVDRLARADIGEQERPQAAHLVRITVHHLEAGADMRREVDLVDHQKVR